MASQWLVLLGAAIHAAHVDLYCGAAAASVARLRELLPVLHAADAGAFHTYVATHATNRC